MRLFTAVLFSTSFLLAGSGLDTLVKIDSGLLAGSGISVRAYKGIPYAAPPVGDLRWKAPQPPKSWKGVRVAKSFPNMCPQSIVLAGGGAGNLKGGRHIRFKGVPLANLHLTLLDQFGVHQDKIGDSTGRIDPQMLSLS